MRRKSERNKSKASPEKKVVEPPARKTRRTTRRRKRSSSRSSNEDSDEVPKPVEVQPEVSPPSSDPKKSSHSNSDEEEDQPVWKVKAADSSSGEIQKLKICLQRPPTTPEKTEQRSPRRRRNKPVEDAPEEKAPGRRRTRRTSPTLLDNRIERDECLIVDKETNVAVLQEGKLECSQPDDATQAGTCAQESGHTHLHLDNEPNESSASKVKNQAMPDVKADENKCADEPSQQNADESTQQHADELALAVRQISSVDEQMVAPLENQLDNEVDVQKSPPQTSPKVQNDKDESKVQTGTKTESVACAAGETMISNEVEMKTEESIAQAAETNYVKDDEAEPKLLEKDEVTDQMIKEVQPKENIAHVEEIAQVMEVVHMKEVEEEVVQVKEEIDFIKEKEVEKVEEVTQVKEEVQMKEVTVDDSAKRENESAVLVEKLEMNELDQEMESQESNVEEKSDEKSAETVSSEETETKESSTAPCKTISTTKSNEIIEKSKESEATIQIESTAKELPAEEEKENKESEIRPDSTHEPQVPDEKVQKPIITSLDSEDKSDVKQKSKRSQKRWDDKDDSSSKSSHGDKSNSPQQYQVTEYEEEAVVRMPRKRKWGKYKADDLIIERITTDTIVKLYPHIKMLSDEELKMDLEEKKVWEERKVFVAQPAVPKEEDNEKDVSRIALNRKISIVDDEASKLQPPPSPAKNPCASVLYITNLVRPFTLKHLKEMLSRTGVILDDGFWTDRIKSKCYVQYTTEEEAETTRNALHGVQWPVNGKKLIIDYSTIETMNAARDTNLVAEGPAVDKIIPDKNLDKASDQDKENEERKREKSRGTASMREWDVGKVAHDKDRSHSREREKDRPHKLEKRRHSRNASPSNGEHLNRKKKKEEDVPAKLMDDLFHKTKATPSIYWLPLTPEMIAKKQQQRLQRMAEHKRRLEESRRLERDFSNNRGPPRSRRRVARHDGD